MATAGTVGAVNNSGTGTEMIDTSSLTVGANTVQRQNIVLSNPANPTAFATNFPAGFLRVTDEPTQLFYDPFDSTLDTTVRWNAAVSSGGGVAASAASGILTQGTGTTANGYAYLTSQPAFVPTIPAWVGVSFAIQIENPVTTNGYRFWGVATVPATPTAAAPLTNAVGFELYTDGKLYAVSYAAGTRTVIQDMSAATGNSTQPTDALMHRYIVYVRTDRTYWYIDQLDTVAAVSSFQGPSVQTLTAAFVNIAGSTPPSSSCVTTCTGVAVWDTGKNNHTISDGTYGWRKATVKQASTAAATTDPALVVAVSPNSFAPTVGEIASGVADANAPHKIGGQARITNPTAVTDGQRVNAIFDKLGKQVVVGAVRDLKGKLRTNIAASTAETTILAAGAAGVFNDIYGFVITNNGSAAMSVTIRDVTAGTVMVVFQVPTADTRGLMLPVDSALKQATAASAWTATCTPNATSVDITVLYVSNI